MSFRLDRFELKFVITRKQRESLWPELMPRLQADENSKEGAYYPIVSLYYDNEERDCYWEKVRSIPSRRKMRVRVYGSLDGSLPPTTFVEVKHKHFGRIVKRRARIPMEAALAVGNGDALEGMRLSPNDRRVVDECVRLVRERNFKPSCCMRYDRNAYAGKEPDTELRITFDTDIGYRFHDLVPRPDDRAFDRYLLPEGFAVMEIKTVGCVPYWLTKLVGAHGCILQSHSKYCNALEDGDPVLHRQLGGRVKIQYGTVPPFVDAPRVVVRHGFEPGTPLAAAS